MNPSRGRKTDYSPARVTLAVLTYLPDTVAYYENRFDVTRLCLESLIANTPEPYDLLVFDNGSSTQMVDHLRRLRDSGDIDYLLLSAQNIGKIGALQMITRFAPGEISAYTDDDIFFLPGWLETHLKVIDTYPGVGMVTGFYIRPHMSYGNESALRFAEQSDVEVDRGKLIPRDWEQQYIDNMGRTWDKYNEEIADLQDVALTYKGVETLISAGHHQFVAPRKVLLEALPQGWTGNLMGQMCDLDSTVDRLSYLRLTTRQPVSRLIGNVVSPEMATEAAQYGISATGKVVRPAPGWLAWLYRNPVIQRIAKGVYNKVYKIVNV
ncbi:MAG: glycosyltransferase family 2 protein [Anaerolineales bacterium]|nr:glycosyltransferase family 2 protein [Anaerolineales bacterium]